MYVGIAFFVVSLSTLQLKPNHRTLVAWQLNTGVVDSISPATFEAESIMPTVAP